MEAEEIRETLAKVFGCDVRDYLIIVVTPDGGLKRTWAADRPLELVGAITMGTGEFLAALKTRLAPEDTIPGPQPQAPQGAPL